MIERLDHVNLRTSQLQEMIDWYEEFLRLTRGPRPPFRSGGAWLYAGDLALVHLVEIDTAPPPADDLALEHAAFKATGMREFLERLKAAGQAYRLAKVPGMPIVQVNVRDPDGNHLHVDFDAAEADGLAAGLSDTPKTGGRAQG